MTTARPIIMAPGVQAQEVDLSQYVRELTNSIFAEVGLAQKGEFDKDILLTSLTNGLHTLGIPRATLPALQNMREYFNAGGGRIHYVRVGDGTQAKASTSIDDIGGGTQDVDAPSEGTGFNNQYAQISYGGQGATSKSASHTFTVGANDYDHTPLTDLPLVAGTVIVKFNGTKIAQDDGAGALVFESTLTQYATYSGTVDYLTGEVNISTAALSVEVTAATVLVESNYWSSFNMQIKVRVLDSNGDQINAPYVVESHRGLTLANMVERLANSQYIDPPSAAFTAFPVAGQYEFTGGDDGDSGILDSHYIGNELGANPTGMRIFARPDSIDINLLAVPKASQSLAIRQAMIQLCEVDRFDTLALIDPPPSLSVLEVADWANGEGDYASYDTLDSSYAAVYYPYYTSYNNITNDEESTPPSAMACAAFARSNPWEAPAGPNRGKALNIIDVDVKLNARDREFLGENRINPLSDIQGIGPMVAGQYTTQIAASSLDRIAARMMLMRIEKAITTALFVLLFEPNTPRTWNRATLIAQPYLDSLVRRERIYDGKFICDRSTNTDDVINNNQMAAVCRLQLLKYAEIIVVTFLVEALGAKITESVVGADVGRV